MSGMIISMGKRHKFAHPRKAGLKWLVARTALALLFICGLVYLANQTMLLGLDKFFQ